MKTDKCIYCLSERLIHNGKDGRGEQRFKCSSCERTFTARSLKHDQIRKDKRLAAHLLLLGYSPENVSVELKIASTEINSWQKKYLPKLNDLVNKKGPITDIHQARQNITEWSKDYRHKKTPLKKLIKKSSRKSI